MKLVFISVIYVTVSGNRKTMELLANLNASQLDAVTATEGFVRVIAGAGSGKTRALSHRFAFLVGEVGILPGSILCVTFTNKAASEMRQRINNLTGDNDTGYINTFHGFCVSVLQEDSHAVQYPKSFLVLDNSDINEMLKIIYEERNLSLRDMTFGSARDMIEMLKTVERPDYYLDMLQMSADTLKTRYEEAESAKDIIFYGYLYQEKKCFGLDYNDLIKFTLYIFEENPEIRLKWQKRLEYIMIDEFQDIDPLQYRLMEVLCGYHGNLFVVGDPDQTIYTWRGANVKYLLDFDRRFAGTKTVMMLENYRSTPQILRAVNSLISKNRGRMKKELIPCLGDGELPVVTFQESSEKEAAWIAARIRELSEKGIPLRDMTILYRSHFVTRAVEDALQKEEIPYTIYSGVQFYDRAEIKDALSYLRMISAGDDLAFLRTCNQPKRNLGERRIRFLTEFAETNHCTLFQALKACVDNEIFKGTKAAGYIRLIEGFSSGYEGRRISEILTEILDKSGYEEMLRTEGNQERLDNLAELKSGIFVYETSCGEEVSLNDYLRHIALFTNQDREESNDRVKLMTVHAAKGLEFPYVFLCGMDEGIFPSRKIDTQEGMEEERRLAYVAMTRAEKMLYLSASGGRNFDHSPRYPSRFLLDIDEDLLDFDNRPEDALIKQTREYIAVKSRFYKDASDRFAPGQRIRHSVFGDGTILDTDHAKGRYEIKFDNIATPRSISFRISLELIS